MSHQPRGLDLQNLAGGAGLEIFQRELAVVAKNIADQNTDAKAARSITLKVTFHPDEKRQEVRTSISAKSTLASVKPAQRTIHLGKMNNQPTLFDLNPQQGAFEFMDQSVPAIGAVKNA